MSFRVSAVFAAHAFEPVNTELFCGFAKLLKVTKAKTPQNFLSEIVRRIFCVLLQH